MQSPLPQAQVATLQPPEPVKRPQGHSPRPLTGWDQSTRQPGGPSALGSSALRPDKRSRLQGEITQRKSDEDFQFYLSKTIFFAAFCALLFVQRGKRRTSEVAWTLSS